ncbi:MAG: hydantoinase/oxoprolinase family protein [Deltaproteobacteria bacterium]|nr:hydantoinase/oxoprolinase family protein [Deltaproteobacteria bacterium]
MKEDGLDVIQGTIQVGIDVGGTFTDLVAYDSEGRLVAFLKVHTTPGNPSEGVLGAFDQLRSSGEKPRDVVKLAHATTIATNTLLEKKGAKTCLLTTRGFEDVLELRRHNRPQMYNLFQEISPPLAPRHLRLGIPERVDAKGAILTPIGEPELLAAVDTIRSQGIESVAISFLHAYANPVHEKRVMAEIVKRVPHVFVSCSSDVWPEFREFERTSTTVLNAYIRPSVDRYLEKMSEKLSKEGVGSFSVMKSNGGLTSAENARRYPVHLIESGPAAGMVSAAWLGRTLDVENIIALDVGGTTAKAGIITGGTPKVTNEFHADSFRHGTPVGGYPIRSPVIDLVEIGAGGGSIAWIDTAGVVKVGPHSAGAMPGPACYGLGGTEPTVTDANLVLGFLNPENFHGGRTTLYPDLAEKAISDRICGFFGWPLEKGAAAIIRIAKANLLEMVRLVSIRKGFDPREFSLLAYGGAGPLHASSIAKDLNVGRTLIPPLAGVFSALGLLVAGVRHDVVKTHPFLTTDMPESAGPDMFRELEDRMRGLLRREACDLSRVSTFNSVDMRYLGQVFELTIPIKGKLKARDEILELERQFEKKYRGTFHYVLPDSRIEIVNFRMTATVDDAFPRLANIINTVSHPSKTGRTVVRRVFHESLNQFIEVPVLSNGWPKAGQEIAGPTLIEAEDTTVFIPVDQKGNVNERGCLIIEPK